MLASSIATWPNSLRSAVHFFRRRHAVSRCLCRYRYRRFRSFLMNRNYANCSKCFLRIEYGPKYLSRCSNRDNYRRYRTYYSRGGICSNVGVTIIWMILRDEINEMRAERLTIQIRLCLFIIYAKSNRCKCICVCLLIIVYVLCLSKYMCMQMQSGVLSQAAHRRRRRTMISDERRECSSCMLTNAYAR